MSAILITGASSGIGRALALHLLKAGHSVWGIARNETHLKQLSADSGSTIFFYSVCDVRMLHDLQNLKKEMDNKGFKPDILLLNAGVTSTSADINHQTNYGGIANTWQVFKSGLQKHGGIVAVSGSLFALVQAPFNLSYSQSKLDALNFLEQLSTEKENKSVRFNYFVLGPINTQRGNDLPWWKSLVIPSPEKTATYITKHLGGPALINIFPLSSHILMLLNKILPNVIMGRLITFLKR